MNRNKIIPLVFVVMFILGLYATAFGGGGLPGPCTVLPPPDHGPFLIGYYIAAYDQGYCETAYADTCSHYDGLFVLKYRNQTHLFSFATVAPTSVQDLCQYTQNISALMALVATWPCNMNVGGPFGLTGTPVITHLSITHTDNCNTTSEMISGDIVIRVVP